MSHLQFLASPMPYTCPDKIVIDACWSSLCVQISRNFNRSADKQIVSPENLKMNLARYVCYRTELSGPGWHKYADFSMMKICYFIEKFFLMLPKSNTEIRNDSKSCLNYTYSIYVLI